MEKPFYSYHQVANGMWAVVAPLALGLEPESIGLSFVTESKAIEVVNALNRAFIRGKLEKALEIRRALGV
jgi:hypothetical protein